jgi:hypothetical protein
MIFFRILNCNVTPEFINDCIYLYNTLNYGQNEPDVNFLIYTRYNMKRFPYL